MSAIDRTISEAIRQARDSALDAAIHICEQFIMTGGSPENCVQAIRDLKEMLQSGRSQNE